MSKLRVVCVCKEMASVLTGIVEGRSRDLLIENGWVREGKSAVDIERQWVPYRWVTVPVTFSSNVQRSIAVS